MRCSIGVTRSVPLRAGFRTAPSAAGIRAPARVVGGAPQLVVVALAHGGIVFLQQPLVADGLRLGVLDGDMPALPRVAVEHVLVGFAAQDADQLVGQIERVVDAAVHAHAADRAVHMGGIAGENRAARAEFFATRWCTV